MGDYSKALEYGKKTLEILEMFLPSNRSALGYHCQFMGEICFATGDKIKGVEFHNKAIEIIGVSLPVTFRDANGFSKNSGITISCIGDDSMASELQKTLEDTLKEFLPQ
jgi:hypothetical protein